VTGLLLFASDRKGLHQPAFRLKMLLILLAGVQAAIFHWTVHRGLAKWDENTPTPLAAKLSAAISILLWISIVAAGRLIGFV
jgi:heme A synthase